MSTDGSGHINSQQEIQMLTTNVIFHMEFEGSKADLMALQGRQAPAIEALGELNDSNGLNLEQYKVHAHVPSMCSRGGLTVSEGKPAE